MLPKRHDRFRNMAIGISVAAALASICIHATATFAQTDTTPSTDGVASASDRVDSPIAVPLSPILPDRPMAITGELPIWQATSAATTERSGRVAPRQKIRDARK